MICLWRSIKVSGLIVGMLIVSGCEWIDPQASRGTTVGYRECIEAGKKQELENVTIVNFCRNKEQRPAQIDVRGSGRFNDDSSYTFTIRNNSREYVLTSVKLYIKRSEPDKTQAYVVDGIWVEPGFSYVHIVDRMRIFQPPAPTDRAVDGQWAASDPQGIKLRM